MKCNKVVNYTTFEHQKSVRREEKSREVKKEELSRTELNKISYK